MRFRYGGCFKSDECFFYVGSTDGYSDGKVTVAWEIRAATIEECPKIMHVGYSLYGRAEDAYNELIKKAEKNNWKRFD